MSDEKAEDISQNDSQVESIKEESKENGDCAKTDKVKG